MHNVLAELSMWWLLLHFVVQPYLDCCHLSVAFAVSLLQLACMHAITVVASLVCHDCMPAMRQPCGYVPAVLKCTVRRDQRWLLGHGSSLCRKTWSCCLWGTEDFPHPMLASQAQLSLPPWRVVWGRAATWPPTR